MVKLSTTGRRRLRMLLSFLFGCVTSLTVALVLLAYKLPYDPIWWLVLGLMVGGAFLAPLLLVPAIEWVIRGYARKE